MEVRVIHETLAARAPLVRHLHCECGDHGALNAS